MAESFCSTHNGRADRLTSLLIATVRAFATLLLRNAVNICRSRKYCSSCVDRDPSLNQMKKVSTGERIKFEDLRRRSVGGPRGDADSDVMSEQRFVSELMDTTPSSSYESKTLPDGYVYNYPDAAVSDIPVRYDSDVEAADEVVTGTQKGVGKADLIVKEDVPEVRRTIFLCPPLLAQGERHQRPRSNQCSASPISVQR